MINITRLNHTAINTASNAEAMKTFYTEHLNVNTVKRDIPEEFAALVPGFWMQFTNGQVHVIENAGMGKALSAEEKINPMGPHIAFYVEDISAVESYLERQKMPFETLDDMANPMAKIIFARDPAGNVLEFQQDPDLG